MRKGMQMWSRVSAVVQTKCQNGEEMWSKWFWPWNDYWCQAGWLEHLRNCWSPDDFHAQQSLEFAENGAKTKTSSEQQFCRQKRLVNERGQRRRARLVKADRKVTVTQITTHYNSGMQKSISEHTTHQTSKWIGYSSRRLNPLPPPPPAPISTQSPLPFPPRPHLHPVTTSLHLFSGWPR